MKKLLLIVLLSFPGALVHGQQIFFSDTTNEWHWFVFSCGGDPGTSDQIDRFVGDTIINDTSYEKFSDNSFGYYAYIREDTLMKKVYAINPGYPENDTTEQLLYDYTLQKGDTFNSRYVTETVDSVDSVIINGLWHKVWYFQPTRPSGSSSFVGYTVVEGIGTLNSPLYPLYPYFFEGCTILGCFHNEGTTPIVSPKLAGYFDNSTSCSLTFGLGVNNVANDSGIVTLYPNPASSELTIIAKGAITTVSISNLLGQVAYSHQYNTDRLQIDVADLPAGVYFVKINGSEVRKFVKQ